MIHYCSKSVLDVLNLLEDQEYIGYLNLDNLIQALQSYLNRS